MRRRLLAPALGMALCCVGAEAPEEAHGLAWGYRAHEMATRAALGVLPDAMPPFFLDAAEQIVWLAPEPDRWHDDGAVEMDRAWSFDHYIDFENVPQGALDAPDRFAYLEAVIASGLRRPAQDSGFLPFRILELHQRLTNEWRRWRAERDADRRRFLEARIIDDAGILAHYVTDGSQPHHTTIHFNGWAAGAPNPEGFSRARDFHSRFERFFVDAHVSADDVERRLPSAPRTLGDTRSEVMRYLRDSHATVEELYRLERDDGFDPSRAASPATHDFAAERLAAGSAMLAELWWSAWVLSGR